MRKGRKRNDSSFSELGAPNCRLQRFVSPSWAAEVADGNIVRLVERFLRAGVMEEGAFRPTTVGMPGMNGNDVARRIREQAGLRHMVLVALTGYGTDEDR